jgi:putative oxidoreductase
MNWLFPRFVGSTGAVGLLAIRLVAGAAMMLHGLPKVQNAMSWMGPDAPVPAALQAAAAVAEFGGGLCWIVGAFTPLASLLIGVTMAVAMTTVHMKYGHPFVGKEGPSYELALVYLSVSVLLLLTGPGKLSVDAFLFNKRHEV